MKDYARTMIFLRCLTGSALTGKGRMTMPDREKVVKGLECCTRGNSCISDCPYFKEVPMTDGRCITAAQADALALLKGQENEENRILKIVWDVLHSTVSVDTEADQDYVYELIRNQVRPMY